MMGFLAPIAGGLIGTAASALFGKKSTPAATTTVETVAAPTRNVAMERARQADLLRRRRGSSANDITGGGAEAVTAGAKTLLGQ